MNVSSLGGVIKGENNTIILHLLAFSLVSFVLEPDMTSTGCDMILFRPQTDVYISGCGC